MGPSLILHAYAAAPMGRPENGRAGRGRQEASAMELRPLGFGEIFDRAVTLYIRNFVAFAGIVLVMIVPFAGSSST